MMSKEVVYVSQSLKWKNHGRPVFDQLQNILGDRLKVLPVSNEWCRDYMPVKGAHGNHVLFKYAPSYLVGEKTYEKTIPDSLPPVLDKLGIGYETTSVVLDGGAMVIQGDVGIVTDRVISENSTAWNHDRPKVLSDVQELLGLEKLVVVPADPFDITGHADGTVRFIDNQSVLVNDPRNLYHVLKAEESIHQFEIYERWLNHFEQTLKDAGFRIEYLSSLMHEEEMPNSAWGIYLNFLLLDDMLIVPFFKNQNKFNKEVQERLQSLYNRPVQGVYADALSVKGGIINCCTWQHYVK